MNKSLTSRIVALVCLGLFTLQSFAGTVTGQVQNAAAGPVRNGTFSFTLTAPATVAGTATVVTSSVPCYTDGNGNVAGEPDPLLAPVLSVNLASGTLPAATYFVKIWYFDGTGNSFVSPEASISLVSIGTLNVLSPVKQPLNASGYRVGISTVSGSETIQGSVTGVPGAWGNFSQSVPLTVPAAAAPVSNTTVCTLRFNDELTPSFTCYDVGLTSSTGGNIPGYPAYWYLNGGSAGTINVGSGTPQSNVCQGQGVVYPQAIVTLPPFNGQQTINGPLNLNGFALNNAVINQGSVTLMSRDCRADGMKSDGVTDDSAAVNTCIANAKANKQTHVLFPSGTTIWTAATINGTNFPGIHISGTAFEADATNPPTQSQGITNIICNQGTTKICLDLTGSGSAEVDHLTMNIAKGVQGVGIGILQGRDNAGGGGSANPLCFTEAYNIHDIYWTDNGGSNTALNSGRGFIGIYNVSAENGIYNNVHGLADTNILFSQNNVLGIASPYQTLQTGCPLSMTGVTMVNPVLTGSATTLPLIEANTTNAFSLFGFQCVGGNACIKFENTAGASPTAGWVVTGLTEQSTSDILATSVGMANMKFFMLIANPPPGFVFKPLAANLTFDQCDFLIDDFFALVPFIDNVQTGTQIRGSKIHIGFATSASNTTLLDTEVFAPTLTDANLTFNAASTYMRYDSSGISSVGTFKATQLLASSNGTLAAPALGITSSSTGWFLNSNSAWQLSYAGGGNCLFNGNGIGCGSGQAVAFSSVADPNNAAVDSDISRIAVGVVGAGTGLPGSTAGSFRAASFISGGAAATLTGTGACATSGTQTGGSMAGRATCTAATAASTLTITPGTTAPNGWVCYAQDQTNRANLLQQTSNTATSCTLTATSVTQNDVIVFSAIAF